MRFPAEKTGWMHRPMRPWHGPYSVVELNELDVTVEKVYHPQDGPIKIHLTSITPCPDEFQAGYHGYEDCRPSPR